jgi:hypothetical protein
MELGARLKAKDAWNLLKPVKVAQTQDKLLKWIENLNSGRHTEHSYPTHRLGLSYSYEEDWIQDLYKTLTWKC